MRSDMLKALTRDRGRVCGSHGAALTVLPWPQVERVGERERVR